MRRGRRAGAGALVAMLRRAYAEFLALPSAVIAGFFLLAFGTFFLDRAEIAWLEPVRQYLHRHIFTGAQATSALLGTIAGGLITITSITISLLLLALQQAAAALTTAVFDQFLRRWLNQFYFGFFVGLTLYALITLASVSDGFNPVFGAALAFALTAAALYLLLALLYTTINQMRPVEIIEEIHRLTMIARTVQLHAIRNTRRLPAGGAVPHATVRADHHGYVTRIDFDAIGAAARDAGVAVEVVLLPSYGSFVACGEPIARVRGAAPERAAPLEEAVRCAVELERQRDIGIDAAHGLEQLEMIGWTSISTAKSNPGPGLLAIHSLRDVLFRWSEPGQRAAPDAPLPVVYHDNTEVELLDAFETFTVVASESMQYQSLAEVLHTFSLALPRVPAAQQARIGDIVLRSLSALGDHVLTAGLEAALGELAGALDAAGRATTAAALRAALHRLQLSVGKLNSRATRVPPG